MGEEGDKAGSAAQTRHGLKLLIEYGPLLAFFLTYQIGGFFWATGVLMVASVAALVIGRLAFARFLPVPVVTAVLVLVFGALTLYRNDTDFLKIKVTVINLLFAGTLAVGLWLRRPLLKLLLGEALSLTDEGWRLLTVRWIAFFVALAGINEIVRKYFSEAAWVNFKLFGILILTTAFAMAQVGLIKRHEAKAGG